MFVHSKVEEKRKLIDKYFQLYNNRNKASRFESVIEFTDGEFEQASDRDQFNDLISKAHKNILLYVNLFNDDAVKELGSLGKIEDHVKLFYQMRICFDSDYKHDRIEKTLKIIEKTSYEVISFVLNFYPAANIEDQINSFNDFCDLLLKYEIKQNIFLNVYTNDAILYENIKEMEKLVLNSTFQMYEEKFEIVNLELPSLSKDLKEWKLLEKEVKKSGVTVSGFIELTGKIKDIEWIESLFSNFHNTNGMMLPKDHSLDFSSNVFQELRIVFLTRENKNSKPIPLDQPKLFFKSDIIRLVFESFDQFISFGTLDQLNNHKSLSRFSFYKTDSNDQNVSFEVEDLGLLCEVLLEKLPFLSQVFDVHFMLSEYKACKIGRQLYETILKDREAQRIRFLIKNGRKARYHKSKVMFLGSGGVGKTSTLRSLLGKEFQLEHIPTNVVDCKEEVFCDINVDKWTEGLKNNNLVFSNDLNILARKAAGDKVEGDVNIVKRKNYQNYDFQNHDFAMVLANYKKEATNITDIEVKETENDNRNVNDEGGMFLTENEKSLCSKKLSVWDLGGQGVFDVLHPLYLTSDGFCILVFNLENICKIDEVKRMEIKQINMWLCSLRIYTKKCKVILVGTRCKSDIVEETGLEKINQEIALVLKENDFINYIENKDGLLFFPVENSLGEKNECYLKPLKQKIIYTLENETDKASTWKAEIPLSWLLYMNNIVLDKGNLSNFEELKLKGNLIGFREEEMENVVSFFTKAGAILNFIGPLENQSPIVDNVVLKPLFLLEALGKIIYVINFHPNTVQEVGRREKKGLWKLSDVYLKTGILGSALLDAVWETFNLKQTENKFLKVLCQTMLIFSPLTYPPKIMNLKFDHSKLNEKVYIVPGMTKEDIPEDEITSLTKFKENEKTVGYIEWATYVPGGMYERVVCSFLTHSNVHGMELRCLGKSLAIFEVKNVKTSLELEKYEKINITVFSTDENLVQQVFDILAQVNEDIKALKFYNLIDAEIKLGNAVTKPKKIPIIEEISSQDWVFDCFLSHSWGSENVTHERVLKFATSLKREGFKVWVDTSNINESVAEDIVKGIDRSAAFVAFLTKDYMAKTGNRNNFAGKEFNYITKRGAEYIIPVVLDAELINPNDWQGTVAALQLGTGLYIDFSSEAKVKENWKQLCKRIREIKKKKREKNNFTLSNRAETELLEPETNTERNKKKYFFF